MKKINILALGVALAIFVAPAFGQDLGSQLAKVAGKNAESYLSPFLSGLGADLNSGFYHSADLHGTLGFDVGIKFGVTLVKDADKTFDFELPATISFNSINLTAGQDYDQVVTGSPTAVGGTGGIPVKVKSTSPLVALRGQTIFTTPPGFDLSIVPLAVPQVSVGLPFGLEVIGRFIPTIKAGDAGKVSFVGFGLRHDIDQYIPLFPVDIAVHFMTQKLTFNDNSDKKIMSASATAFGVEVSKSLVLLTVYGGFQIESSKWEVEPFKYKYTDDPLVPKVDSPGFSIDGKNKSRFHAGVRLLLLFINVHADYSFAPNPVATAGVGITFR
ncbi:MAG: DUF6588 family protein [Bacteroidota bacterium]